MTKYELIELAMKQCALELNCMPDDFKMDENVITMPKNNEGRRHFISGAFFFRMITFGGNAVISADKTIHNWLSEYVKDKTGHYLFEENHQIIINKELEKYNKPLWMTTHSYLPIIDKKTLNKLTDVKWFEEAEIIQLYNDDRFHNALQYKINNRPDVLAVASYNENGEITGAAGASADTHELWQIGIDVLPQYRGIGIATYLVTLLKEEILKRGKIPYYSTSQSNIYSQNIAMNSGFFPAWVEAYSTEPKEY
ncbi:MAG: N-acetyltransferase [Clostridia bacterium]|nr:N-acetyltransferase [Clostridia bacterium]